MRAFQPTSFSRQAVSSALLFALAIAALLTVSGMAFAAPPENGPVPDADQSAEGSDARRAEELLPPSTLACVQMPHPDQVLDSLLNHSVYAQVRKTEPYVAAITDPKYLFFLAIVSNVESQIGMTWKQAVATLLGNGVTVAFDPETEGVIVIVKSTDAEALSRVSAKLVKLVRAEATRTGKPDPLPTETYRDVTIYGQRGQGRLAVSGPWLIATNKDRLGQQVLDRILDGGAGESLANRPDFEHAWKLLSGTPSIRAWGGIGRLRDSGNAPALQTGRAADNPVAELLLGGVLNNLQHTPFVTAGLTITRDAVQLELAAPHQNDWIEEAREYWFGHEGSGTAGPLLQPAGTVFSLSTHRQISEMWLRAGDLFNEKVNDGIAQADSNLSTLFAGRDFGEDVLGSLGPQLQFVAARQDFAGRTPVPAIKLPAFALAATLNDPEVSRPELRRTFQSLIGFLNVVGAMNGNPQLDQNMEEHGETSLLTSRFVAEPAERESLQARVQFNFSPSVAFFEDRFVLASTAALARELAGVRDEQNASPAADAQPETALVSEATANTQFALRTAVLRDILSDNREQLIAGNMLDKGHTREEAEREIGLLLTALGFVKDVRFQLTPSRDSMRAVLEVRSEPVAASRQ